jgi:UDP-2,3-diacylglucosamine hydrolase
VAKRALFISDLHLAGGRPEANEQFFRFLQEEAVRADALYVLGDLFESWAGDDELAEKGGDPLASQVAAAFKTLAEEGVQIRFMHGNRDFLVGKRFLKDSGAQLLDDPCVVKFAGKRLALLHGDTLCTDDHDYQAWRRKVRSAAWQREFLAKPLAARREAVAGLREKSKDAVAGKPAEIMDVNQEAVREVFRHLKLRHMIHGHTHRPARHEHEVDGARCERWVLPDWYGRGGYLALDNVGPRLVSF